MVLLIPTEIQQTQFINNNNAFLIARVVRGVKIVYTYVMVHSFVHPQFIIFYLNTSPLLRLIAWPDQSIPFTCTAMSSWDYPDFIFHPLISRNSFLSLSAPRISLLISIIWLFTS